MCVVRLQVPPSKARPQAETLYLLVKRGEKGLLAGQPMAIVPTC